MSDADWISFDEAVTLVMDAVSPLGTERVPLSAALGRSLARRVDAVTPHPPWDNSAMDGFAVRADEVRGASRSFSRSPTTSPRVPSRAERSNPARRRAS